MDEEGGRAVHEPEYGVFIVMVVVRRIRLERRSSSPRRGREGDDRYEGRRQVVRAYPHMQYKYV